MAPDEAATLRLIGVIYETVLDWELWGRALKTMTDALAATGASFSARDPPHGKSRFFLAVAVDQDPVGANEDYFRLMRDGAAPGPSCPTSGALYCCGDVVSEDQILASAFYTGFLKRNDIRDVVSLLLGDDDRSSGRIRFMRSSRVAGFDEAECRFIAKLAPHISRAVGLQKNRSPNGAASAGMSGLIHQLPMGVCVVDPAGRIATINRAADAILREGDGMTLRHGRIAISSGTGRTAFERCLSSILAALPGTRAIPTSLSAAVPVARPSGRQPYRLLLTPLPRDGAAAPNGDGAAAIWIQDPERRAVPRPELLRQLYGLSAGEAALVASIAAGHEVSAIADARNVQRSTVVTQLKRVFIKTGINRQRDLAQIWAGLPVDDPA